MRSCIFCKIVEGTVPASVVYEDDQTMAFMDLHQATPGHVLIIPKEHFETIDQLPAHLASAIFPIVVRLSQAVKDAYRPDGLTIFQSNGKAATQEVPHLHIHIMPRFYHDGVLRFYTREIPGISSRETLDRMARQIRDKLR
jgi:histidine triad (HIT) family protein